MTTASRVTRASALAAGLALAFPVLAADEVRFRDKAGNEQTKQGAVVSESPDGVQFRTGGNVLEIPAKDVFSLTHADAPPEFRQAEEAEQGGEYAAAAELYQKSLDAQKVGDWIQHDGRYRRAECLYHLGDLKGTAATLAELCAHPKGKSGRFRSRALVLLAKARLFQQAFDQAKADLDGLRGSSVSWEDVARECWLARIAEAQKEHEKARQAYGQVVARAAAFQDLKEMAQARAATCLLAQGKVQEALNALPALVVEGANAETSGGAAIHNANGAIYAALSKASANKDEARRLAFTGLWSFLKVVVQGEAFAEEHAAAYAGAEQCFALLGDDRARDMKAERKRYYNDAFVGP